MTTSTVLAMGIPALLALVVIVVVAAIGGSALRDMKWRRLENPAMSEPVPHSMPLRPHAASGEAQPEAAPEAIDSDGPSLGVATVLFDQDVCDNGRTEPRGVDPLLPAQPSTELEVYLSHEMRLLDHVGVETWVDIVLRRSEGASGEFELASQEPPQ